MRGLFPAVVLALVLLVPVSVRADSPQSTVERHVNAVLAVLKATDMDDETKREKLRVLSDEVFDFTVLSRGTLGKNWKQMSASQRTEFVLLFRKLLEKTYLDRAFEYQDERVVLKGEKMFSKNRSEVRSTVISGQNEIPVDYRLVLRKGQWRVYDVVVEGVSLVKNYRTQFREILVDRTPEDLLAILRDKTRDI
jgi:phospholipid transport system substrate-binding protein